jgi:hypothetical protein
MSLRVEVSLFVLSAETERKSRLASGRSTKRPSTLNDIQGVSEFERQTFRADSMIKNKHNTLNTYGVKNA